MTYLYAGLGIAMISGIAAMMQIGINLNSLSPISALKKNLYLNSTLPSLDRKVMKILYTQSVPDEEICDYLKNNLENSEYEDSEIFISTGRQTPSQHSRFLQSCALVNKKEKHRIVVANSSSGNYKYRLFSCYLKNEPYCDFEINK